MVYAQPRIRPGEWDAQSPLEFWHTNRSPTSTNRRSDLVKVNKKRTSRRVDFAVPAVHRMKLKEIETRDKWLDLARKLKKNNYWTWWWRCYQLWLAYLRNLQRIGTRTGRIRNKRIIRDHPDYSIIKIGQNTEKSPNYLRRLAITQTPGRKRQLTLVWKTLVEQNLRK